MVPGAAGVRSALCGGQQAMTPVAPAWYVPLLRWCRIGRVILDTIMGIELGDSFGRAFRIAWRTRKR